MFASEVSKIMARLRDYSDQIVDCEVSGYITIRSYIFAKNYQIRLTANKVIAKIKRV